MILFSIIIPAYNSEKSIYKSIESVIKQTYSNWELIIVDDGSTDGTRKIVESFLAKKEYRIIYLSQANAGPGMARNNGIKHASGDYICFLDSDDYWEDYFLEIISDKLNDNMYDIVFYDLIREHQDGRKIGMTSLSRFSNFNKEDLIRFQISGLLEWGMTKVIKKTLIDVNRIMFDSGSVAEEAIFSFDVLNYSNSFSFLNKPIYHYVFNKQGQHAQGNFDPWRCTVDKIALHLKSNGCISRYECALNSLAARAFCISCYRISSHASSYKEAKSAMRLKYDDYKSSYCFEKVDKKCLDFYTKILLFMFRARIYFPIFIASVLRRKRMG